MNILSKKMAAEDIFHPTQELQSVAHVSSMDQYKQLYKRSIEDPDGFWKEIAQDFYWESPCLGKYLDYNFDINYGPIFIKFMANAKTNICYNVLDRNIEKGYGQKIAFHWEGNDPNDMSGITYASLKDEVCKFANVLKLLGIKKGDCVAIYMPMIIELAVVMLACARIGAIHSIIFAGFSCESLAERILDSNCTLLITADGVWRGTKLVNLKDIADRALQICEKQDHILTKVIVTQHLTLSDKLLNTNCYGLDEPTLGKRPYSALKIKWQEGRDIWYHDVMSSSSNTCEPVWVDAEDPLFLLYTSGSTGKPKGILHTVGGYMLYTATTFKYTFDYQPDDIFWCTADIGWITGHSYVVYGPLANGATGVMFEGMPLYPDAGRLWEVVAKYKVTKFYTAPTAIRSLMKYGDSYVTKHDRSSLKVLGTVGEPINPEAWLWYHRVVGEGLCAIVDTFWQTETGGHVITSLPGATPTKPGSASFPFFGIVPTIVDEEGKEVGVNTEGYLTIKQPWPGIMRTVYGDHARFETTYFTKFPGMYTTGDGAKRDSDGYIWITGRIDDMVNVSGHLLSTAEIESALIEHDAITEAAVVSHPHAIKGACTYCFVTLKQDFEFTPELVTELKNKVRMKIGPFAQPDYIQNAPSLPKTRSGKIMRRVLRKISVNDKALGDVSTLADESVIDVLFKLRPDNTNHC